MRELLLLRHAKSSWDDPGLDDFERPLAGRGRKAAPLVGRAMAARRWLPGFALVSPALRTRQTWERLAPELPAVAEVSFADAIYEAGPDAILSAIHAVRGTIESLLVVGHNPGLEMLAADLAGPRSDASSLVALRRKFPTAALARFSLDGRWRDVTAGTATLTHFVTPKALENRT